MYLTAMERLEAAGYEQYEISNVARPGFESRHNLKYWTDGEWSGFGCGAHSTVDGIRWKNLPSTEEYVDRVGRGDGLGRRRASGPRGAHGVPQTGKGLGLGLTAVGHAGCSTSSRRRRPCPYTRVTGAVAAENVDA